MEVGGVGDYATHTTIAYIVCTGNAILLLLFVSFLFGFCLVFRSVKSVLSDNRSTA